MVLRLKAWESRSLPGLASPWPAGFRLAGSRRSRLPDFDAQTESIFPRNPDRPYRGRRLEPGHGAGWSSLVARQAHNLKVVGSNPTPATTETDISSMGMSVFVFSRPFRKRPV